MAGLKMRTDPEIRARLGGSALSHLRTQLRAVDCQTCGSRFRRWQMPALAVYAEGERAQASLHHAGCHRPGWHEGRLGPIPEGRYLTWRAGTFVTARKVQHHWLDIPLTAETARLVRSRGSIVVAVTTRVDVYQPLSHFQVEAYRAAGLMAVGVAALSSRKDTARRRRKR